MNISKNDATLQLLEAAFKNPYEGKNPERVKLGLSLISRPTASQRQTILSSLETARSQGSMDSQHRKMYNDMIDHMIQTWWPVEKE